MHTTMVPVQVKTMKIQAGVQVSRQGELRRHLQLWKRFGRLYLIVFVLVRNVKPKKAEDDIMESVISCETAKVTWTDLVYSFEGPSNTKENRIMDMKLEYQTFKAKTSETLSQTNTRYKTLLNELANDGVTLSKHEINVGFVNSLPENWLSFSQRLRNVNHTQILEFLISMEENSDDEVDERTTKEYLKDLDIKFHERALLENSKHFIKRKYNFSSQKANEDTGCYKCGKKGLVAKTFNWDKEEVLDDEEETHVKVLIALADDELLVGKNHACNGEWIDIAMKKVNILLSMDENLDWQTYLKYINIDLKDDLLVLKQAKLETVTFQIQNTKLTKLNHALQDQLKEERKVERLNPDSKLPNFNTGRILVPESQAINECLQLTKESADPESSKESGSEPQTPLPLLKNL
ncbi:hypothetical protein Tco_1021017 [Tanacetum coccineum]